MILGQLESCDPEDEDLLLAVLWLLLANSLLENIWERSDAVTMVTYVDHCIREHVHCYKVAHVVAMVSYCVCNYSTYCQYVTIVTAIT